MVETRYEFQSRLRTLGRKHRALERGSMTQMRKDGLIVVRPVRRRARKSNLTLRTFTILLIGFFAIKGFMLASIGEEGYAERLATLEGGTALEQVGAKAMQPELVSQMFSTAWVQVLQN